MNRQRWATLGIALWLGVATGRAQDAPPPPPGAQPDLNRLTHELAERVRHLGEDISSDLGQNPQARHLLEDTTELAQAVDDLHETLHGRPNPFEVRRAYAGIDGTWHHLRSQLLRPGVSTPGVERAAVRVDQLDQQIHRAISLREPPQEFFGNAAPVGVPETRRLALSVDDRAQALAAAIQADMADQQRLVQDAQALAQAADNFYDFLREGAPQPRLQEAFGPVVTLCDRLEPVLAAEGAPPHVANSWQAFASSVTLLRQNIGLPATPPQVRVALIPAAPGGGPSPLVEMADRLVVETDALVRVFGPTADRVPEGRIMLAEAERLRAAAAEFRQDAARDLNPAQLAFGFREVDAIWGRLARRVRRIAKGRTGPNIQQVEKLGAICQEIHQLLAMPGYPPAFAPAGQPVAVPLPDDGR